MRIGFITSKQSNDVSQASGDAYYMEKALERHCGQVIFLTPSKLQVVTNFLGRRLNNISKIVSGKSYASGHTILTSYCAGLDFAAKTNRLNLDVIFATKAATQIAYLRGQTPIIYTSDATFKLMENFYGYWSNLNKISIREGNYIEQRAIRNANQVFYPTSWPIDSAIKDYHAKPAKLSVIKSGANFDNSEIPPLKQILYRRELSTTCNLLFVGVEWDRKGGEIAIETLHCLRAFNIPAKLTIVGCLPPEKYLSKEVTVIEKLNKTKSKDRKQLAALYQESDFFLLPTRAEAAGLVFNEAAAFALPVITTDTGGVSSIVRRGVNGYALPHKDRGASYARTIKQLFDNPNAYKKMCETARQEYEAELNWDTWGKKVNQLIKILLPLPPHIQRKDIAYVSTTD